MNAVKYKIGPPLDSTIDGDNKIINNKSGECEIINMVDKNTNVIYTNNRDKEYEEEQVDLDMDDIDVNDGYDGDNDSDDLNQVVVVKNSACDNLSHHSEQNQINHSDTASSSESGFGTVDDDVENNSNHQPDVLKCQTLQQSQMQSLPNQSANQQSAQSSTNNLSKQFPILQPPRQIIYELSKQTSQTNNSDDVVNILNDNSSINSSLSSNGSLSSCCSNLIERLTKLYYSFFCCYSTTSHQNQTPCIFSWLSIFCCCCPLLGGISLYLTHRSKKFKSKQKYELADKYSNYAEKLNIASLIFGIIFYAVAFFIITLVIFMYWRPHHS